MRTGFACRVDANHGVIGAALRQCGFLVLDLSRMGKGVPDYLIKHGGFWAFVEVKTATGTIEDAQREFSELWPVVVLRTVDDVVTLRARIV